MKKTGIGIDLGTSNSAAAGCIMESGEVCAVGIPQIAGAGEVSVLMELPSVLYIPPPEEAEENRRLPWIASHQHISGAYAGARCSEVPDRVIVSAKSWLCFHQADPKTRLLPPESSVDGRLSPFDTSRIYLEHIRHALEMNEETGPSLSDAEVVLTVPASFDEIARNLTVEAAHASGFGDISLLEEPLAAFYHWLHRRGDAWRRSLRLGDLVLVCDVGGGTADFTLISVEEEDGDLVLKRLSVGRHILLGGDNMDLALALHLQKQIEKEGRKIDRWQFLSLVHGARIAKEQMLSGSALAEIPVSIMGKGSGLFSSAVSTLLAREDLERVILEGFVPFHPIHVRPSEAPRTGLMEAGLPYAADPALTHHLADFLVRSASMETAGDIHTLTDSASGVRYLMPNAVLFNGGVFNAEVLRRRVMQMLESWSGGTELRELGSDDYASAVAKGAAVYARIRATGRGVRVRAGLSRPYYMGLEQAAPAAPGYRPPLRAVCVAPRGMEEGTGAELPGREFVLYTGESVRFRFFSGQGQGDNDYVGVIVDDAEDVLESAMELEGRIVLPDGDDRKVVPVRLRSMLSSVGLLELWLEESGGSGRWKLELDTRVEQ